jgi:hypothetical protein
MKTLKALIFSMISFCTVAEYDPCKHIKLPSCGNRFSINKTTGSSQSTSGSAFSIPSSMADIKGFGLETIIWDGLEGSIISGNGKVGAGVSSSNTDDTFFGNTAKEYTQDYIDRVVRKEGGRYKFDKLSLGLATTLFQTKKKFVKINAGIISKYISSTSNWHFGGSLSSSIGPLNLGYARFRDEGQKETLDSSNQRQPLKFSVETYTLGLNLPYISFDYTMFDNKITPKNRVEIYSAGFFYYKWMISYGRRVETSNRDAYDFEEKVFHDTQRKWSSFFGLQYRTSRKWVFGAMANYYLKNELSFVVTGFF